MACAFSPDGSMVVSAGWDCSLKLCDTTKGGLLHSLEGHTGYVFGCAFSPDGATGYWPATTGRSGGSRPISMGCSSRSTCRGGRPITPAPANRLGIQHLAFPLDDLDTTLEGARAAAST